MSVYRYGYVWRHRGKVITTERECLSHSGRPTVAQAEILRQRQLLGLPADAVVHILWRMTVDESQRTA